MADAIRVRAFDGVGRIIPWDKYLGDQGSASWTARRMRQAGADRVTVAEAPIPHGLAYCDHATEPLGVEGDDGETMSMGERLEGWFHDWRTSK